MAEFILGNDCFYYLSIIFKYFDKNNEFIKTMIKYCNDKSKRKILLTCLKSKNRLNHKFIYDYFEALFKLKYCFSKETFDKSIDLCQNNKHLLEYKSVIEENYNKLKIYSNGNSTQK